MKTKHSPGPWYMEPTSNDPKTGKPYFYYVHKNHQNIGSFNGNEFVGVSNSEARANAVLASAAPEMLEMLQELLDDTEVWSHLFPEQQEKIKVLIQKATS